ncbi:MAG TPA: Hsp20/alpha crystallin family protein [Candidatus Glassbacteria bacterium]|nr:Hsp20/alpha crystallin family protein [Candidatus Glassbacteria bacterium]
MRLVKWNPNRNVCGYPVRSFWDNEPFAGLFPEWFGNESLGRSLEVDITDKEDHFELTAELPGIKNEDLRVTVENDTLTIEAEKKSEHEDKDNGSYYRERRYGKFSRSFKLNGQVDGDKVDASYKDGVLTLRLLKREEVKARAIEVKVTE